MQVPYRTRPERSELTAGRLQPTDSSGGDSGKDLQAEASTRGDGGVSIMGRGPSTESHLVAASPKISKSVRNVRVSSSTTDENFVSYSPMGREPNNSKTWRMKEGEDAISPLRGPARPDSQRIRSGDDEEAGGEGDHQVVRGQGQQEPPQRKPSLDSSAPTAPTPHRDQTIINGRWRIERVLGKGSFGTIQLAVHIHTGEEVAVKMERKSHSSQLTHERRVYRILDGAPGFPRVHAVGENDTHRYIVMDRMGPSLEDLLTMCGNKLSVTTVMQIAEQMISRVQELHENGIIHRDIKPDNFCLGLGKGKTGNLYAIDFGLSKQFLDLRTNRHIAERRTPIKDIIGTARYCSLRSHEGQQLARRDDIESVGYVLVYLAMPGLPWQGLKAANTGEKYASIWEVKRTTPTEQLCRGLPRCFQALIDYAKTLEFEQAPDYALCRQLFNTQLAAVRISEPFDWLAMLRRGELSVCIVEASKLLGKSSTGVSNPYCTLRVSNGEKVPVQKERTEVVMQQENPTWDAPFEFAITDPSATLEIYVWSKGVSFLERDRFLGRVVVRVSELAPDKSIHRLLELRQRSSRSNVAGSLQLRLYHRRAINPPEAHRGER